MGSDECQERFSRQMVNVNLEKKVCRSFPSRYYWLQSSLIPQRIYKRRAHVVSNREKNKLLTLNTHLLMYKTRRTKLYRIIIEE